MQKFVATLATDPRLALAAGLIIGLFLWSITLPFAPTVIVSASVVISGVARPWLAYRVWVRKEKAPRFTYGGSQFEHVEYEKAMRAFKTRKRKIVRSIIAWTIGIILGFFPLTVLTLL